MSTRSVSITRDDTGACSWRVGQTTGPPFTDELDAVYGAARDGLGWSITRALAAVNAAKQHGVTYRNRLGGGDVYVLNGVQWTLP